MAQEPRKRRVQAARRRALLTPQAIENFFNFSIEPKSRMLFIGSHSPESKDEKESGVDAKMAERVVKGLTTLATINPREEIIVIMNTPGGDMAHGWAIYDAIALCPCPVTIKVLGQAMSMGCVILQAAKKRLIASHANIMIHYGSSKQEGTSDEVERGVKNWREHDLAMMENIFLARIQERHPGFKREELIELLKVDTYMNAQGAVDLGLADEVIGLPS